MDADVPALLKPAQTLWPPSQPGTQVEDAAMDMEARALSKPAQMFWPPSQPGSQIEDAAMDAGAPALPKPAQTLWPPSQPGSQVEDAAMDTDVPALLKPAQTLWPPSQPGSQGRMDDAAMDMEASALHNPGQLLWPQTQPGSMPGSLGQSAYAQSGGMAAGFSADGGFGAVFPPQGVGATQPAAVQSAGCAGPAAGFSPSGPIRPLAVRASFQMPPSPLHPPLPVATTQGPSFGSLQSSAAAGGFQPCGPVPWQHIVAGSGSVAPALGAGTASFFPGGLITPAAGPDSTAAGPGFTPSESGFTAAGPGSTAAGPGFTPSESGFTAAGPEFTAAGPAGQPAPNPPSLPSLAPGVLAGVSTPPQGPAGSPAQGGRPAKPPVHKVLARAQAAWASPLWGKQPPSLTAAASIEPDTAHGSSQAAGRESGTAHGSSQAAGGAPCAAPGSIMAPSGWPSHQHSPITALASSGAQVLPQAALPLWPQQTTTAMGQAAAGPPAAGALALLACLVHVPAARISHAFSMHAARHAWSLCLTQAVSHQR